MLELAREKYGEDQALAKRYVTLARKTAMRHRIQLGNKAFCKKCGVPWIPGKTLKVRLKGKTALYICLNCNNVKRFPYSRKEIKKRE